MNLDDTTHPSVMVFTPTLAEMSNFTAYIETMEAAGAHRAGLAKIIPPHNWKPRKSGYKDIGAFPISSSLSQYVHGVAGVYQQENQLKTQSLTLSAYRQLASLPAYCCPPFHDLDHLESLYWRGLKGYNNYSQASRVPIYGADRIGTLIDPDCTVFNLNTLDSILTRTEGITIPGVTSSALYFGMWRSAFAWHTEDLELYSINYLHLGAPKFWYAIPPEAGRAFEELAQDYLPAASAKCSAFLRHKETLISPGVLQKHSIPFVKAIQEEGQFMVTFPYAYHSGFNTDFNIAEATNFATPRWIEYGKRATQCHCRANKVRISMDPLVRQYQPEKYQAWVAGQDLGVDPKDPNAGESLAPKPPSLAQ